MAQPPPCWISYRQCVARAEPVAPERDWYGCRKCGQPYGNPRARSDPAQLRREKEELKAWQARSPQRSTCFRKVSPVRVPIRRTRPAPSFDNLLTSHAL
jgi:hypothetical protein